jgi:hypothetical protein
VSGPLSSAATTLPSPGVSQEKSFCSARSLLSATLAYSTGVTPEDSAALTWGKGGGVVAAYYTGDGGTMSSDGQLVFHGRFVWCDRARANRQSYATVHCVAGTIHKSKFEDTALSWGRWRRE